MAAALSACTLAWVGAAQPAKADLEVTVPPGPVADWALELPQRFPFVRGGRVVKPAEVKPDPDAEPDAKGTTVRRGAKTEVELVVEERAPTEYGGNYQPMFFAGVKTEDLPIHLTWVSRKTDASPAAYPPAVTDDLYWMAQAAYLRRLLHPGLVGESEILWHLVAIGQGAREVGGPARGELFLTPLIEEVEKRIPTLPAERPKSPSGFAGTAEQKMLLEVVAEDLARGEVFTLDPTFAARTLSRGEELWPQLEACIEGGHPLHRRNGVVVIGHFQAPGALELIRKVYREDWEKDPVAAMRALLQLVRREDREVVPDLVKLLGGEDARARPLAAWALGGIGDPAAVDPLLAAIDKHPRDAELVTACAIALGRLGDAKEPVLAALAKLKGSLVGASPRFVEERKVARPEADIPDPPALRNRLLLEVATAALARLGDKAARKETLELLAGRWYDAKAPRGHANASGPDRNRQVEPLQHVCPTSIPSLCDALAEMGKDGLGKLLVVVQGTQTDERLRVALLRREPLRSEKRLLGELASVDDVAPGVKAAAMKLLYNVDPKAAARAAEQAAGKYAKGMPMMKTRPEGDVTVIAALEILYQQKKLSPQLLKACVARASGEYDHRPPEVTAEGVKPFQFSPPILEVSLHLLGLSEDKSAVPVIRKLIQNEKLGGRAEGALALGLLKGGAEALVDVLEDDDPWVRYAAYLGLKQATGQDHFADWIYGRKPDLKAAREKWAAAVAEK